MLSVTTGILVESIHVDGPVPTLSVRTVVQVRLDVAGTAAVVVIHRTEHVKVLLAVADVLEETQLVLLAGPLPLSDKYMYTTVHVPPTTEHALVFRITPD